jgi:hypothetical protein
MFAHNLWDLDCKVCHSSGDNDVYLRTTQAGYPDRFNLFLEYYVSDSDENKPYFADMVLMDAYLEGGGVEDHVVLDRVVFLLKKYFAGSEYALSWALYLVTIARRRVPGIFEQLVFHGYLCELPGAYLGFDKQAWAVIQKAGPEYLVSHGSHLNCVRRIFDLAKL